MENENKSVNELLSTAYDPSVMVSAMRLALENDTQDWDQFYEILSSDMMRGYINRMVGLSVDSDETSGIVNLASDIGQIVYVLCSFYNYSGKECPVSDYDYDRLYEMMVSLGEPEIITTPIRSSNKRNVPHRYLDLRGTLSKVYSFADGEDERHEKRGSLEKWIEKIQSMTGIDHLLNEEVFVFPKWDGVSIEFEFDSDGNMIRALTRGDTDKNLAQDVTNVFKPCLPKLRDIDGLIDMGVPHGLQTEILFPQNKLDWYNREFGRDYKTTRSIVSGLVNSIEETREIEVVRKMIRIKALRVQTEAGINSGYTEVATGAFKDKYISCKLGDFEKIRKFADKHHVVDGLNCDGAVIRFQNEDLCKLLGRRDAKSAYEVAYKFAEEVAYAKVEDIRWNLTGYGKMWPNVKIKPVKMHGCTISCPSLGSYARFKELNLAVADVVKVLYDIVPYVMYNEDDVKCKRSGKLPIQPPTHCPECGTLLEEKDASLICPNSDCTCRKRAKLEIYLKRIGCKGIGSAAIKDLWDTGTVRTAADLYKVTDEDMMREICNSYGIHASTMHVLLHELNAHATLPLHTFLSALGVEGVAEKTFREIEREYSLDDLIFECENSYGANLVSLKGIGSKTAGAIANAILMEKDTINDLLSYVEVIQSDNNTEPLFRITFHKIRDDDMEKYIESRGGEVGGKSKATTALCVPNKDIGVDSKVQWAIDNEIPVVKFDDLKDFIDSIL